MVRSIEPGARARSSIDEKRWAVVTHLGLGDGIVQAGLMVALLARCEELAFPSYPKYSETFKSIFANHPQITVYEVPQVHGEDWGSPRDTTYNGAIEKAGFADWRQIRLGLYSGHGIGWDFTKNFYEHAGIPYEMKWRLSPIPAAWKQVPQIEPQMGNGVRRIFLHDDASRGFHIRRQQISSGFVFSPPQDYTRSVLSYAQYLIHADEVHCIDSGFFWLADSLPVQGRLFLHKYARWQRPWHFQYETFRYWNYID